MMWSKKKKKSKYCTEGILPSQMKNRCLKLKHIKLFELKDFIYLCGENLSTQDLIR